jgi:hypothetical protein
MHIRTRAIDHVGGSSRAHSTDVCTSCNADDVHAPLHKVGHQQLPDCSSRAPYDCRRAFLERPVPDETRRRDTGVRKTGAVLEAQLVGQPRQPGGGGHHECCARSEDCRPAHARARRQVDFWPESEIPSW